MRKSMYWNLTMIYRHMGEIQKYFEESKNILLQYHIESVKTELTLSEQSRISEFTNNDIKSQDIERLHARLMIYYSIVQNI